MCWSRKAFEGISVHCQRLSSLFNRVLYFVMWIASKSIIGGMMSCLKPMYCCMVVISHSLPPSLEFVVYKEDIWKWRRLATSLCPPCPQSCPQVCNEWDHFLVCFFVCLWAPVFLQRTRSRVLRNNARLAAAAAEGKKNWSEKIFLFLCLFTNVICICVTILALLIAVL